MSERTVSLPSMKVVFYPTPHSLLPIAPNPQRGPRVPHLQGRKQEYVIELYQNPAIIQR